MKNDPILLNAKRLADDAKLLLDHHRQESATALAILAIEEIGKFLIVNIGYTEKSNSHRAKLRAAAGAMFIIALEEAIAKNGLALINVNDLSGANYPIPDQDQMFAIFRDDFISSKAQLDSIFLESSLSNDVKMHSIYRDSHELADKIVRAKSGVHALEVVDRLHTYLVSEQPTRFLWDGMKIVFDRMDEFSKRQKKSEMKIRK